jgi:hypothetical protein
MVRALVDTLADGGQVYFLGIVDPAMLAAASVDSSAGSFLFHVDDIMTAIPEPATGLLLGSGLALLASRRATTSSAEPQLRGSKRNSTMPSGTGS